MTMNSSAWVAAQRLGGLRRFAIAITILNILGHTIFGFEQAWITPFVAVGSAYFTEFLLEWIEARLQKRKVRFLGGGPVQFIDFFLSAHISGLAVGMLLYANSRLGPVAFAASMAIASKALFRVRVGERTCHFFNPSNFGITITLLLFSWVGIAPPYQFTEGLDDAGDWILPAFIICTGSFLNYRFTKRLPLVATWICAFALQAILRHWLLGSRLESALAPMTGTAFILFSFYMVSDPATTPSDRKGQILFGAGTAFTYGVLVASHVVFGLFFSLTLVSCVRGSALWVQSLRRALQTAPSRAEQAAAIGISAR